MKITILARNLKGRIINTKESEKCPRDGKQLDIPNKCNICMQFEYGNKPTCDYLNLNRGR